MQALKLKCGITRFPYGGRGASPSEHPAIGDWLAETVPKIKADPRTEDGVWNQCFADTPITMTRNRSMREAKADGVDLLLMIDSDMNPDLYVQHFSWAKRFWDSSFDFVYDRWHKGPCCIAAPYCGPPPHPVLGGMSSVYVFKWTGSYNEKDLRALKIDMFTRDEAAFRRGIEEVAALPTGLILIDLRICELLKPPWFSYEWRNDYQDEKASTEDVFFTRNCSMAGAPQFCNWDAWAGHAKPAIVGKPVFVTVEDIMEGQREAIQKDLHRNDYVESLQPGKSPAEIAEGLGLDPPVAVEPTGPVNRTELNRKLKLFWEAFSDSGLKMTPAGNGRFIELAITMPQDDVDDLLGLLQQYLQRNGSHPVCIVEIGTWTGKSSIAMADLVSRSGGEVHCIDPWSDPSQERTPFVMQLCTQMGGDDFLYDCFVANVGDRLGKTIIPHRDLSEIVAKSWDKQIDFLFIDGDHRYEEVKKDIQLWRPHMKPGGLIAGHDFAIPEFPGVSKAVQEQFKHVRRGRNSIWWTEAQDDGTTEYKIGTHSERPGNRSLSAV